MGAKHGSNKNDPRLEKNIWVKPLPKKTKIKLNHWIITNFNEPYKK